jgi:hypothetical protein
MSCVADGIDFMLSLARGQSAKQSAGMSSADGKAVSLSYAVLFFGWLLVWGRFSDRDFSCIVTASSYVTLTGFIILAVKIHGTKSVAGLSSRTLALWALFYSTKLVATALKSGYNPVDSTGDYVYQLVDFAALLLVCHLLYCVHKTHVASYQEELDTFPLHAIVLPCFVLGYVVRANFNQSTFFDTMFAASVNLETVVMLPQLWMLGKVGGRVDTMTAHFVASTVAANVMTFVWWWYCAPELEKRGPCMLAKVILVSQGFRLFLAADFLFYYFQALFNGTSVILPTQGQEMDEM